MTDTSGDQKFEKTEPTLEDLIDLDPDFYKGCGDFEFPNGDKYNGEYYAHRSGKIWREGEGVYTTKDGQIYSGFWQDDKLIEGKELQIEYDDRTLFNGTLLNNKYTGAGMISFIENMKISCDFQENKPIGNITLFDKFERMWFGTAEKDEATLLPEHVFFSDITKDRGKGLCRKPKVDEILEKVESKVSKSDSMQSELSIDKFFKEYREWEREIFQKKSRVDDTIDFEESEWWQTYVKFRDTYEPVIKKAKLEGIDSLDFEEKMLYDQYNEFKENYLKTAKKIKSKEFYKHPENIYDDINKFKKKCPPISVIYPNISEYLAEIDIGNEYEEN